MGLWVLSFNNFNGKIFLLLYYVKKKFNCHLFLQKLLTTRDTPTLKTCHISLEALIKTPVPFLSKAIQEGK